MALTSRERQAIPQLRAATMRLSRRLRQERRDDRLTPIQLAVLGNLSLNGAMTPGDLAATEHVRPPTMSRIIAHLQEDGWVVRRPHPDDGRQSLIELTPQAWEWIETYREARDRWLYQRLEALSPSDRETLLKAVPVLEQLVAGAPSPR